MPLHVSGIIANCDETPITLTIHGFGMEARTINLASDDNRGVQGPPGVGYYYTFNVLYDSPTMIKLGNLYPPFTNRAYAVGFQFRQGIFAIVLECPKIDLSGIYFVNSRKEKKYDTYNTVSMKKIPNPTVRTALIGE